MLENLINTDKIGYKRSNLEGASVTRRDWKEYQEVLGINPIILNKKKILNFGSGYSDIGNDLNTLGINCYVVDLDMKSLPQNTNEINFIKGNGRLLPFRDKEFNFAFGLWSNYQITQDAREKVYTELMRVAKILHLSPIFKNDFNLLSKLSEKQSYEIIASLPTDEVRFMFSSEEDYSSYVKKN